MINSCILPLTASTTIPVRNGFGGKKVGYKMISRANYERYCVPYRSCNLNEWVTVTFKREKAAHEKRFLCTEAIWLINHLIYSR